MLKILKETDVKSIISDSASRKSRKRMDMKMAPEILYDIDSVRISDARSLFVTGWARDVTAPLLGLRISGQDWTATIAGRLLGRGRPAADVGSDGESLLQGFWALAMLEPGVAATDDVCSVELALAGEGLVSAEAAVSYFPEGEFRDHVAVFLAAVQAGEHRQPEDLDLVSRVLAPPPIAPRTVPRHTIESISIAEHGGIFVAGWINDTAEELAELRISSGAWRVTLPADGLARSGRDDVQAALALPRRHAFGFWGLVADPTVNAAATTCICDVVMKSGAVERHALTPQILFDQIELRNLALTYLASSQYLGNPMLDSVASLEKFIGRQVVELNMLVSRALTAHPHIERFVGHRRPCRGSIVVCLYGKLEYMFLQCALFSGRAGIDDYELVYVSNSPELAEPLLQEARLSAMAYGLNITVVLLSGNAGFGAANNVAVAASQSARTLIVNPDVFPLDQNWAAKHTTLVEELPADQTRLFGAPLYYDDGSLMHGGMYFDGDSAISVERSAFRTNLTLRVEHFGKGAPPSAHRFLVSRPVPAITGAFMSLDRTWFEKLGGFSEEYVLGHYEDADLCLKSIGQGTPPWMHNIKLWHLEGKGSGRRQPFHEGASIVNRWLFNKRWAGSVVRDMLGQRPTHPLLQVPDEPMTAMPDVPMPAVAPVSRQRMESGKSRKPHRMPPPIDGPLAMGRKEIVFEA
jgi:GT2 family glycosyltransferase